MSDVDREEQLLLSRARAGLSPSADAAARMRRAIASALVAGPVPTPASPGGGPGPRGLDALVTHGSKRAARLLVAMTIVGTAGTAATAGYWLGYRAGSRDRDGASAAKVALSGTGPAAPSQREAPPLRPDVPAESDPRAVDDASRTRARSGPPRPARPPLESAAAESLAKEVTALRGVERALRDGQSGLALALLQELDRTVPNGKLVEEREATAAIARCVLGRVPLGVDLAGDFAERHPDSVYLKRVEQSCRDRRASGNPGANSER